MSAPPTPGGRGRETRLLLVTIGVSVAVLLLLARFRFPDEPADRPVEAAPAPLERLAAQAPYDELASIMADLERRIAPRVWIMRSTAGAGAPGTLIVAPRVTPDRAVILMEDGETFGSITPGVEAEVLSRDLSRGIAVIRVPAVDDGAVAIRTGAPRQGPRYVGVVEATSQGPTLRPVYVGRLQLVADPRTGTQQLSLSAPQHPLPRGAAIFTLDGVLLGLVRDSGESVTVVTAEFLRAAADTARPSTNQTRGSLGLELEPLSPVLARATGADRGVVVTHVDPTGPAAKAMQSGDVIQSLDGTAVSTPAGLRAQEAGLPPGATVTITGVRRGSPLEVTVVAADAAPLDGATPPNGDLGIVGRSVAGAGVEVVTVRERSPAALAGLAPADLIVAIDGQPGPDTAGLTRRYRAAEAGRPLLLTVQRGPRHHVLALEKR